MPNGNIKENIMNNGKSSLKLFPEKGNILILFSIALPDAREAALDLSSRFDVHMLNAGRKIWGQAARRQGNVRRKVPRRTAARRGR